MSRYGLILEGLNESRKSKEVRCPRCNSNKIDHWEENAYYCNSCGHEFDKQDLKREGLLEASSILSDEDSKELEKILLKKFKEPKHVSEGSTRVWSEEEVKYLIQTNDKVLYGALKHIYACQTEDEKRAESTREHNGVGFNSFDAEFMTSICKQLEQRGTLSAKQKEVARKKLVKYNKQLTRLANQ